ncbi:uncharacterized protein LOC144442388 [Glandiceps talaboti]
MLWLRLVGGCLLLAWCTSSVDPRALHRNRPRSTETSGTSRSATSEPSYEQIVSRMEDLSRRFGLLERELQLSTYNNERLEDTIEMQTVQIDILLSRTQAGFIQETEGRLSEIENRMSSGELCGCSPTVGGGGDDDEQTGGGDRRLEGWVERLDPDSIHGIIEGFDEDRRASDRSLGAGTNILSTDEDDDDDLVELNPEAISILSKAFAQLITQQAEGDGLMLTDDEDNDGEREEEIVDDQQENRQRPTTPAGQSSSNVETRPRPKFPFRRPSRRLRRDVTRSDLEGQLEAAFTSLVRAKKDRAAFSAVRTQPLFGSSEPQPITFQKNQANKGKDFVRQNGVFTCEIPGTYYFSFTMRSYDSKHIGVALMLDENPVVAMTTDPSNRKVMQTQSVMLELSQGDRVWLLLGPSEDFALYGNELSYNTFNGVLLFAK